MTEKELQDKVLDRPGHPDGTRVPEGYFETFVLDMASRLPENDLERQPAVQLQPLTRWQRVRPYVYMAAMFAGIWCMMKMFSLMRDTGNELMLDRNPTLTAALSNDDFVYDYVIEDYSEDDLLDVMYDDGVEVHDFITELQ